MRSQRIFRILSEDLILVAATILGVVITRITRIAEVVGKYVARTVW